MKKPIKKPVPKTNNRSPAISFKFSPLTYERLLRSVAKGSRSWFVDMAINEALDRREDSLK